LVVLLIYEIGSFFFVDKCLLATVNVLSTGSAASTDLSGDLIANADSYWDLENLVGDLMGDLIFDPMDSIAKEVSLPLKLLGLSFFKVGLLWRRSSLPYLSALIGLSSYSLEVPRLLWHAFKWRS
jgi:hypothetical protein